MKNCYLLAGLLCLLTLQSNPQSNTEGFPAKLGIDSDTNVQNNDAEDVLARNEMTVNAFYLRITSAKRLYVLSNQKQSVKQVKRVLPQLDDVATENRILRIITES